MKLRLICFLIFMVTGAFNLQAQYYTIGQEPTSVKWKQIRTENFRVVYPDYYEVGAIEAARLLELHRPAVTQSLKVSPLLTPVVMHTGSIYSNAYSIWAPRRMEFLTTPPQETDSQSWIDLLVVHEYRHVAQLTKMNMGFTRFLGILTGQQAASMIVGLFIPPWFLEGDAVATETALSRTGRGRVADFALPFRTQLVEREPWHYTKAILGSYRDFIPDRYVSGYHIIAASRMKYGMDVWNSALERSACKPYTLNPFSKGIQKVAGMKKEDLYYESMSKLQSLWKAHPDGSDRSQNISLIPQPHNKVYTNYYHPFSYRGGVIALKNSLDEIPVLVFIDSLGKQKRLFTPGFMVDNNLAFNGTLMSWAEIHPHVRWENQATSTLVLFDPATKHTLKIKTHDKLYAPRVSPDNQLIVAVRVTEAGQYSLAFLDLHGQVTAEAIPPQNISGTPSVSSGTMPKASTGSSGNISGTPSGSTGNVFLTTPSWSPDGKSVVCVLVDNQGKRLAAYNLEKRAFTILTPAMTDDISFPCYQGDQIVFSMDVNERTEVCRLDPATGRLSRLTESAYGTTHPSPDGDRLLLAAYTIDGYRVAEVTTDRQKNILLTFTGNNNWVLANALSAEETAREGFSVGKVSHEGLKEEKAAHEDFKEGKAGHEESGDLEVEHKAASVGEVESEESIKLGEAKQAESLSKDDTVPGVSNITPGKMTIRNYGKAAHLFNIHSWAPLYVNIDDQIITPGVSVMSQNLLSTMFLSAGYDYNTSEEAGLWRVNLQWKGWFPVLSTSLSTGTRSAYTGENYTGKRFNWYETSWDNSISQQLTFVKGKFSMGTFFGVIHQTVKTSPAFNTPDGFHSGTMAALGYRAYGYILQKQAHRDFVTPLGFTIDLHYKHSPYGDFLAGELLSVQSRLYLPGLFKNHSIQLYTGYQRLTPSKDGYIFSGDIDLLSGYDVGTPREMLRLRPSYSLPLAYPDFHLETAFYLKRLRGTAFYDYSRAKFKSLNSPVGDWFDYTGVGFDLLADYHLLALPVPVTTGIRVQYLNEIRQWEMSLLLSMNLYEY